MIYSAHKLIPLVPVIAIVQQVTVMALDAPQIYQIAENVSVLIDGQNPGSGVIIAQKDKTYYVLTAKHVIATEDEYTIVTPDSEKHILDYTKVTKFEGVDLALAQFDSEKEYKTAQLANSDNTSPGMEVHIYGFPNPGREITQRVAQFTSGQITSKQELNDGYGLVYTNVTRAGMSGGPVLDSNGRVVGIHGRAEAEELIDQEGNSRSSKIGFNLGIPIATFVDVASDLGLNLTAASDSPEPSFSSPVTVPVSPTPTNGLPSRPTVITAPENNTDTPVCAGRNC